VQAAAQIYPLRPRAPPPPGAFVHAPPTRRPFHNCPTAGRAEGKGLESLELLGDYTLVALLADGSNVNTSLAGACTPKTQIALRLWRCQMTDVGRPACLRFSTKPDTLLIAATSVLIFVPCPNSSCWR
jgi:hypothetical protein